MYNIRGIVLSRAIMVVIALLGVGLAAPSLLWAKGVLENPQAGSSRSGIGVISGWVCNASSVDIVIDEVTTLKAAYGTDRRDTTEECDDTNNGFGLSFNWNLLGDGVHTIRALADGIQFDSATFTVITMFGMEYLRGVNGSYRLANFPWPGVDVVIIWEESSQNFVIGSVEWNLPVGPDLPGVGAIGP